MSKNLYMIKNITIITIIVSTPFLLKTDVKLFLNVCKNGL